jgi:hypothetical protein
MANYFVFYYTVFTKFSFVKEESGLMTSPFCCLCVKQLTEFLEMLMTIWRMREIDVLAELAPRRVWS